MKNLDLIKLLVKLKVLSLSMFICLVFNHFSVFGNFFSYHGKGWHWYEKMPSIPATRQNNQSLLPLSPSQKLKVLRKNLEDKLALALLEPTIENVKSYMVAQKILTDQAKHFSQIWLQTVFTNPSLDHSLKSPVNQKARYIQIDLQKQQTEKIIKDLAKEYGLFFFFKSDCPYCFEFAPIVKEFANIYGWQVLAISSDGKKLEEFPNSVLDNGLIEQWQIAVFPALFAIHPKTSRVIPIAYGLSSIEDMEKRIVALSMS
jgi:conjugal transfer pilus assembly protein TraF